MVAGSIIVNKLGMNKFYVPHNKIMQYGHIDDSLLDETVVLKAEGIC
jgi:hypothetical protein